MRYAEILRVLMEEPLLLMPAAHASLARLFAEHRSLEALEFRAKREGVDVCGEAVELAQMEVLEGVAVIPLGGPGGVGLGKFEKGAGAVDLGDVAEDLRAANADPGVRSILLDIDSPGGMVSGTLELADRVMMSEKPVYAFTGGMMASAAYWIGCSAERVFATKSAEVGGIGVYTLFLDSSRALEAEGRRLEVVASGPYKGLGVPGTALSERQRSFLQARVDGIAAMFQGHVSERRGGRVDLEDMQGQSFLGEEARGRGLVDAVVMDLEEALEEVRRES
ncbi:MAG TPA: S49 family peptidase [Kiritimatiellia bacterium]|nr:S49 family peptidase [Kiritimatiellia bacterium]